eukprot:364649-Chlamydomonas_euryale.AAC.1
MPLRPGQPCFFSQRQGTRPDRAAIHASGTRLSIACARCRLFVRGTAGGSNWRNAASYGMRDLIPSPAKLLPLLGRVVCQAPDLVLLHSFTGPCHVGQHPLCSCGQPGALLTVYEQPHDTFFFRPVPWVRVYKLSSGHVCVQGTLQFVGNLVGLFASFPQGCT